MSCPINDIRNFKAERNEKATDNVVNIKREAPIAAMHFARADEAESIEVVIMDENKETITCEEVTMRDIDNTEKLRTGLNNLNETINETLNEGKETMNVANDEVQVEEISMAAVDTRMKTLNRKSVILHAGMAIGTAATIMATAKKYGRSEKAAAVTGGIIGTLVMLGGIGDFEKAQNREVAENASEAEYQEAKTISIVNDVLPAVVGTVLFGAIAGRFLVKKAAASAEE